MVALPLVPREHDGRLSVQLGVPTDIPFPVQTTGVSTPVHRVQVLPPPWGTQSPAKTQLENPVTSVMVH